MPSQGPGITVTHLPDDAGYRLIELPMEVESLLESDTAPVLTLDSTDSSAVLRTPTKSFSLRQKNTSNALFLLRPQSQQQSSSSSSTSTDPGLASVATIHETVELDAMPDRTVVVDKLKSTGSRGKWHEKFGSGR